MLTATGQCPKCFAINSQQATKCIDCGAPLPWAGGTPAPTAPTPVAQTRPAAPPTPAPRPTPPTPAARPTPTPQPAAAARPAAARTPPPASGGPFQTAAPGGGPFQGVQEAAPETEAVDPAWANNEATRDADLAAAAMAGLQRPAEPIIVHITGDVVVWPEVCPCCLGPNDAIYEANAANGSSTHVWPVPCCRTCLKHMQLYDQALKISHHLNQMSDQVHAQQAEAERVAHSSMFTKLLSHTHPHRGPHIDKLLTDSRRDYHNFQAIMEELSRSGTRACCSAAPGCTYANFGHGVHMFALLNPHYGKQFKQLNRDHIEGWAGSLAGRQE